MSSEFLPEQNAPTVTFGKYVAPETVQEFLPPEPAAPVPFAPEPAARKPAPLQTPFGKAEVKFDPDLIAKGLLILVVFFVSALAGYFFSLEGGSSSASLHPSFQETQSGPRLTSPA